MEGAKPSLGSCELPTGVKIESGEILKTIQFREMCGSEEDLLASSMPVSQKISLLLTQCTKSIGTLDQAHLFKSLIEKLPMTDRMYYLIQLRIQSLGSSYAFEFQCDQCQKKSKHQVDLREIQVLNPPDAKQLFQETKLPSGNLIRWQISNGQTERELEKLLQKDQSISVGLFVRCTEFNQQPITMDHIKNLSMKDRSFFKKEIEKNEGTLDDQIEITCSHCGYETKEAIAFDASFFYP